MRLTTFLPPGAERPRAGEVRGDRVVAYDWARCSSGSPAEIANPPAGESFALADVTLLAPVPRPGAILGIGFNYADHAREWGRSSPRRRSCS